MPAVWPDLPDPGDRPLIVVAETASAFEAQIIRAWAKAQSVTPAGILEVPSMRRRFGRRRVSRRAEARFLRGDDPLIVPVRIAWTVPERDGRRAVRPLDLLTSLGDPRDPDPIRQRWIHRRNPDRCQIVVAEPATADEIIKRWRDSAEAWRLGEFAAHLAWIGLERAERRLRGNRYKVARFVPDTITRQGAYLDGIARLAEEADWPFELVAARTKRYLKEIAANHSTLVIDLVAHLIHLLYTQGYQEIDYDRDRVLDIYSAADRSALVFLPSHKSQLDRLVMQYILWENDLPPSHTAGGININFWPVGPLVRRSGVFFIRRSFKDNEPYKFALKTYLRYLLSRRFPIEWFLEGGRSRTGKLRAPSYGMLSYIVSAFKEGATESMRFVPVSISYDQLFDVGDYATEARGGDKRSESIGYVIASVRRLKRRHGRVYIRFGEPMEFERGDTDEMDPDSLDVAKLAFEVMHRINEATPITPTALACLLMLDDPRATEPADLTARAAPLIRHIEHRGFPVAAPLGQEDDMATVLLRLREHEIVAPVMGGMAPVAGQELALAFYKNTMIHHLLPCALAQMADALPEDTDEVAAELRDLLKFDFFFAGREAFLEDVRSIDLDSLEEWFPRLVLLPFFEGYLAAVDTVVSDPEADDRACLGRASDMLADGAISRAEAVSLPMMRTALQLVDHLGLREDRETATDTLSRLTQLIDVARRPAPKPAPSDVPIASQ
jgi:glycerol-3-phosphate O-acyltransferase